MKAGMRVVSMSAPLSLPHLQLDQPWALSHSASAQPSLVRPSDSWNPSSNPTRFGFHDEDDICGAYVESGGDDARVYARHAFRVSHDVFYRRALDLCGRDDGIQCLDYEDRIYLNCKQLVRIQNPNWRPSRSCSSDHVGRDVPVCVVANHDRVFYVRRDDNVFHDDLALHDGLAHRDDNVSRDDYVFRDDYVSRDDDVFRDDNRPHLRLPTNPNRS